MAVSYTHLVWAAMIVPDNPEVKQTYRTSIPAFKNRSKQLS